MKPSKLKEHFERSDSQFAEKYIAFFKRKEDALKNARMDSSGYFFQSTEAGLEASYCIALRIAKNKKPHQTLYTRCSKTCSWRYNKRYNFPTTLLKIVSRI